MVEKRHRLSALLEDVNHLLRNNKPLRKHLGVRIPPGLSDADWLFSVSLAAYLDALTPNVLTAMVQYYLHEAVEDCTRVFSFPLDKHLNLIVDDSLRAFCEDALCPVLRCEVAISAQLGKGIMAFVKWAEKDTADNWEGGAFWKIHSMLDGADAKMAALQKTSEVEKQFREVLAFAEFHSVPKVDVINMVKIFAKTYLDHAIKNTSALRENLVFSLAQLGADQQRAQKVCNPQSLM
jgi:hypothetical protein